MSRVVKTVAGPTHPSQLSVAPALLRRLLAIDGPTAQVAATFGALLVCLIGVPLAALLNIWVDEAFTLHSTGAGIGYAWQAAIGFEAQPPLYFLLEAAWRLLDEGSPGFARFPSIVAAAGFTALIVLAAHRIAPRVPPCVVALATALNPLVIWAAVELRLYAFVLLIGAALTWSFYAGFLAQRTSASARIWYVVAAIVGVYTQYYVSFVLVAHGLTIIAQRRTALRAFLLASAAIALAFAPFMRIALLHFAASGSYVQRLSVLGVLRGLADAVAVFVLPHEPWLTSIKIVASVVLVALGVLLASVGRPVLSRPQRSLTWAFLASFAVFTVLLTVSGTPIDLLRHIIVLAPPTLLVVYALLSELRYQALRLGLVCALAFAIFAGATLWSRYHPPLLKVGDWQRVAALLTREDDGAPVAVFPADLTLLLDTYAPQLKAVPIPGPMPFTLDYDRAMTLDGTAAVAAVLDPIRATAAELWVVTTGECTSEPVAYDYHCGSLATYLNNRYRPVKRFNFSGALVELYTRAPAQESTRHGR